jgi:TonB family protein
MPVALAVLVSMVVHLGLSSIALYLATRPLKGAAPTSYHAIELVPEKEISPVAPARFASRPREVGRLGVERSRSSELSAQTHALSRTAGTAAGQGRPKPRKDQVTGDDTRNLSTRVFTHRTVRLKKHGKQSRVTALPTRRPESEEPTPFLAPGSARPKAGLRMQKSKDAPRVDPTRRDALARKGEQLSRIPLEGTAPDRSPRRQPAPADLSRQRLRDRMEGAKPAGRGDRSGKGRGSLAGRRGSQAGGDRDRYIWLSTHDRRYLDYFQGIYRKVNPLWLFPKKLEVLLEQGDVLIQFTILADGTVKDVRIRKSSGFKEFDRNVVAAIHKAAPFGPIPKGLGRRLRILAPFEFANPMVR